MQLPAFDFLPRRWLLAFLAIGFSLVLLLFKAGFGFSAQRECVTLLVNAQLPKYPCFHHTRSARFHVVPNDFRNGGKDARTWFQNNWYPAVRCLDDKRLGAVGDGGKWVCDPDCLLKRSNCLVFSVGSKNQFDFEEARCGFPTSI